MFWRKSSSKTLLELSFLEKRTNAHEKKKTLRSYRVVANVLMFSLDCVASPRSRNPVRSSIRSLTTVPWLWQILSTPTKE
jgi:hypothetical protein